MEHLSVMNWPPQSSDLNFTEAAWEQLDREQNKKAASIQRRALNGIREAWRTIPEDSLKKFQESCLLEFTLC